MSSVTIAVKKGAISLAGKSSEPTLTGEEEKGGFILGKMVNRSLRKRWNGKTTLGYLILIVMALVIPGCSDNESSGPPERIELNPISWMTDQIDVIGTRTLREICIPGSHDAGMSGKTHCWMGEDCNTQTQEHSIYEQLCDGARYFDIRPTRWGGNSDDEWYAGHFQHTSVGWLGCTGQSLDSILDDVRKFCSELGDDSKELIILNFSHCYVVHESGGAGGRDCYDHEWEDDVLNAAKSELSTYLVDWSRYHNPVEATFSDRGQREYVLLRFETDDISTDAGSGVYTSDDFPIYNEYSNTEDLDKMVDDQFAKLIEYSEGTNRMFLLSYTLTLTPGDAEKCEVDKDISILKLAGEAKDQLPSDIQSKINDGTITQGNFPNVIYVDKVETTATEQAVLLNSKYEQLNPWWEYINDDLTLPGVFGAAKSLAADADYSVFTGTMAQDLIGLDSLGKQFFKKSVSYDLFTLMFPAVPWQQYVYATDGYHCISRFLLKDGTGSDYRACTPLPQGTFPKTLPVLGAPAVSSDDKVFVSGYQIWEQDLLFEQNPGAWLFGYTNDDAMKLILNKHVADCVYLSPPLVDYSGRVYVATKPQENGKYRCRTSPRATLYGYDTEGKNIIEVPLHRDPSFGSVDVVAPLAIGWGPDQDDPVIFVAGSGYLMAYKADTGDPHFSPIHTGSESTGAVYSPIDDRVYVGARDTHLLLGYTFQGEEVFKVDVGSKMSEPVYVQWDTKPPAYCICVNTSNLRTVCYASDGLKIYDQHIVGDGPIFDSPPAIPCGASSFEATNVYVTSATRDCNILARQGTLHHPGTK